MRLTLLLTTCCLALSSPPALAQQPGPWGPIVEPIPVPAALVGYCAVALRDQREWMPGDPQTAVEFDSRRYQFSGPRQRDMFIAAPETYVPMLAGDCPVTFAETNKRVPGQLETGLVHNGRLVFFASRAAREQFLGDPARFQDADLALGGACIVTQRTTGRTFAGIPETLAIRDGLRYWFASAHDRTTFLSDLPRDDGAQRANTPDAAELPARNPAAAVSSATASTTAAAATAAASPWNPWSAGPPKARAPRSRSANDEDVLLGALPSMAGYCPVTLRQEGAWVRGRYEHRKKIGELVFLLAGPQQRDAFEKDPARYIPALGGDCAVSLVVRGERVRGSVWHAYEYEGRLFLFADADRKAAFKANPTEYASIDLAAAGRCVVTQLDEGREVPGAAEFAAWHEGKLYRFAGPDQRQAFLAAPDKYAEPSGP